MEADFPRFPSVYHEAVHEVIIIVDVAVRRQRRRYLDVKRIDEVIVEIRLQMHASRKLRNGIVLIQSGHPGGLDNFLVDLGRRAMIAVRSGLGNHHRQVRFS